MPPPQPSLSSSASPSSTQSDTPPSGDPGPAASSGQDQSSAPPSSPSAPSVRRHRHDRRRHRGALLRWATPRRAPRLYREFQTLSPGSDPDAVGRSVWRCDARADSTPTTGPSGPADTAVGAVTDDGDVITVDLEPTRSAARPPGRHERAGRVARGAAGRLHRPGVTSRRGAPVQFSCSSTTAHRQVLGVPAAEPLANDPALDTLSLVSLSTPGEGDQVTGDTLGVEGAANSFEATVPWQILQGDTEVLTGFTTAEGAYGTKLWPFTDADRRLRAWLRASTPSGSRPTTRRAARAAARSRTPGPSRWSDCQARSVVSAACGSPPGSSTGPSGSARA